MPRYNCYIPLASGQSIPHEVLVSLGSQSVTIDAIPCCTPGLIRSNHDQRPDPVAKVAGELASRNLALTMMKHCGHEFAVMMDRDVVHLSGDNIQRAIQYMKEHSTVGIVSLPWLDNSELKHVRMQCLVIRVSALEGFTFRKTNPVCCCHDVLKDMNALGWEYKYFPSDKKLIRELEQV